jgi:ribosomal protein S18 acetylase RimI-like enzyme
MASYSLDGDALVLWKLYVVPAAQGTGVGSALMAAVAAAAEGCARVRLAFLDGNDAARGFYESRGFRLTGTEVNPAGGPDNVWMEKTLG